MMTAVLNSSPCGEGDARLKEKYAVVSKGVSGVSKARLFHSFVCRQPGCDWRPTVLDFKVKSNMITLIGRFLPRYYLL